MLTGKRAVVFWVSFGVGLTVLTGAVFFVVFVVLHPPPGPAVASTPVVSGQPFSVEWVSDGAPMRAWLDVDTLWFGFPIQGTATVKSAGVVLATEPIDVHTDGGYAVRASSIQHREILEGHLLFDVPVRPAGAPMRVEGVMTLQPQTVVTSTDPSRNSSTPPAHTLRFWIAP